MAPEISPPGRFAHRNTTPPAEPIASVSSTLRVLVRLGMADAIDAGIRLTPPYGKSACRGQMRQRDAAMRIPSVLPRSQVRVRAAAPQARRSYPAKAGYPVRRGFAVLSPAALEYWITRFRG